MNNIFQEFKKFSVRGNVIDIAVGMIIGAGMTPIASSFINDIIMPPVGYLLGNADLSNLFLTLKQGVPAGPYQSLLLAKEAGAITINYGKFINSLTSFLVLTWVAFFIVKISNRLRASSEKNHSEEKMKVCSYCCSSILKKAVRCPYCTTQLVE